MHYTSCTCCVYHKPKVNVLISYHEVLAHVVFPAWCPVIDRFVFSKAYEDGINTCKYCKIQWS